jgi:hypothetical protein
MYNTRQGHCYYSIQGRALSSTDDEWALSSTDDEWALSSNDDEWALSSNDDEWALSSRYVYVCTQILGIDVSGMCVCVRCRGPLDCLRLLYTPRGKHVRDDAIAISPPSRPEDRNNGTT